VACRSLKVDEPFESDRLMFEFGRSSRPPDRPPVWPMGDCIRCGEAPRVDEFGYCGHCHWVVRTEVMEGLQLLSDYLRPWALFMDWCAQRGQRIA
jgi:hypothetical protein